MLIARRVSQIYMSIHHVDYDKRSLPVDLLHEYYTNTYEMLFHLFDNDLSIIRHVD